MEIGNERHARNMSQIASLALVRICFLLATAGAVVGAAVVGGQLKLILTILAGVLAVLTVIVYVRTRQIQRRSREAYRRAMNESNDPS